MLCNCYDLLNNKNTESVKTQDERLMYEFLSDTES